MLVSLTFGPMRVPVVEQHLSAAAGFSLGDGGVFRLLQNESICPYRLVTSSAVGGDAGFRREERAKGRMFRDAAAQGIQAPRAAL
jgi:hypothetical protein